MPCVTYLMESDVQRNAASLDPVADKDLIELMDEIGSFPGQPWSLRKDCYQKRRLFRRSVTVERYSLYAYVHGPEWQCIHFPTGENGDGTYELTRQQMACFLLGYRMAWHDRGKAETRQASGTEGRASA